MPSAVKLKLTAEHLDGEASPVGSVRPLTAGLPSTGRRQRRVTSSGKFMTSPTPPPPSYLRRLEADGIAYYFAVCFAWGRRHNDHMVTQLLPDCTAGCHVSSLPTASRRQSSLPTASRRQRAYIVSVLYVFLLIPAFDKKAIHIYIYSSSLRSTYHTTSHYIQQLMNLQQRITHMNLQQG